MLFIQKEREVRAHPPRRQDGTKQAITSDLCSAYTPVAPLSHLLDDSPLEKAVRLHIDNYFLQSFTKAHESLQIWKFIQSPAFKHKVLI